MKLPEQQCVARQNDTTYNTYITFAGKTQRIKLNLLDFDKAKKWCEDEVEAEPNGNSI